MKDKLVGFIGAGNMARSLAGGLLANDWDPSRLILSDPDSNQRHGAQDALGVNVYADNTEVAKQADVLVLAVKPQVTKNVAQEIAASVQQRKPLVISIAAGIRISSLEHWLGGDLAIVRAMPNTPALIGSGATGLFANQRVTSEQRDLAESILRACGVVAWVTEEALLDVVTGLSGSGPAYFFLVMEALEKAAVDAGLNPETARLLTLETAYGAAKMALEGGEEPSLLRKRVTSPGGTTERAVEVLEKADLRQIFATAVTAAIQRSAELAAILDER